MLTVECRNNHIVALQCLQADFADIVNKALSYGRKDLKCIIQKNNEITAYLRLICEYSPFTVTPQNAWCITFGDTTGETVIFNAELDSIKTQVTLTNELTGIEKAQKIYNGLINGPTYQEYNAAGQLFMLIDGNVLYFYTYPDTPFTVTSSDGVDAEDIVESPCAILDLKNCLSREQLCTVVTKAYELFGVCASVPAENDSGILYALPSGVSATTPSTSGSVVQVKNVTSLPGALPNGTTSLFVNITSQTSNIEVFGWAPTGLANGAHVRVRKQNSDAFSILFTDGVNDYSFVDAEGEFMDFVWDGINNQLIG